MTRKRIVKTDSEPTKPEADSIKDDEWLPPPPKRANRALAAVAARSGAFRPAREVLTSVVAVPTIFPQLDYITKVGGLPIQRFIVVHGPSGHGKTQLCLGLGLSFLKLDHFFDLVDAEFTTPDTWLDNLMSEYLDSPLFGALRPNSYEETVEAVRMKNNAIIKAKREGELDKVSTGLFVIDSIRKLVPNNILDKIAKGEGGVDGMGGRAAQIKAAMNASWLDELIPKLYAAGTTMIAIARESENTNVGQYDPKWKMTGGKALEFDSSLIMRIERAEWTKQGTGDDAKVIGEKHKITIRKTKVAGKEGKTAVGYFHTSNGQYEGVPEGFDRPRDVLGLATKFKIVNKQGSWFIYGSQRIQGENQFVRALHQNPQMMMDLETKVRGCFTKYEPEEASDEELSRHAPIHS